MAGVTAMRAGIRPVRRGAVYPLAAAPRGAGASARTSCGVRQPTSRTARSRRMPERTLAPARANRGAPGTGYGVPGTEGAGYGVPGAGHRGGRGPGRPALFWPAGGAGVGLGPMDALQSRRRRRTSSDARVPGVRNRAISPGASRDAPFVVDIPALPHSALRRAGHRERSNAERAFPRPKAQGPRPKAQGPGPRAGTGLPVEAEGRATEPGD